MASSLVDSSFENGDRVDHLSEMKKAFDSISESDRETLHAGLTMELCVPSDEDEDRHMKGNGAYDGNERVKESEQTGEDEEDKDDSLQTWTEKTACSSVEDSGVSAPQTFTSFAEEMKPKDAAEVKPLGAAHTSNSAVLDRVVTALKAYDLPTAAQLLQAAGDINVNAKIEPPLIHVAAWRGALECVRLLVAKGADTTARCVPDGGTAMHFAACKGFHDVLEALLQSTEAASAVDHRDNDGITALHLACGEGHLDAVRVLVENGADMNVRDTSGATPLHYACARGFLQTVKLLLKRGANPRAKDRNEQTAGFYAAGQGYDACVDAVELAVRLKEEQVRVTTPPPALPNIPSTSLLPRHEILQQQQQDHQKQAQKRRGKRRKSLVMKRKPAAISTVEEPDNSIYVKREFEMETTPRYDTDMENSVLVASDGGTLSNPEKERDIPLSSGAPSESSVDDLKESIDQSIKGGGAIAPISPPMSSDEESTPMRSCDPLFPPLQPKKGMLVDNNDNISTSGTLNNNNSNNGNNSNNSSNSSSGKGKINHDTALTINNSSGQELCYQNTWSKPPDGRDWDTLRDRVRSLSLLKASMTASDSPFSFNPSLLVREIPPEEIKIQRKVGQGAFGIVYRATWRGTTVAVKELSNPLMDESEIAEFRHECSLLQQYAHHPNCVRFFGCAINPPRYWMVLEFCELGSLETLLIRKKVPLEDEEVWRIITEASAGILHLHHENIIHRDIASRNILVTHDLTAKISDFGMCRVKEGAYGRTNTQLGPVRHMAPESMLKKEYDEKSDAFSFGIFLWEVVAKSRPYPDLELENVIVQVCRDDIRPAIPPHTPQPIARLMQECWGPREFRPSFDEIYERLFEFTRSLQMRHSQSLCVERV